MDKNYKVIFSEKGKVEFVEWPMPEVGDDELLLKAEITQISTGTELTMLNGGWNNNVAFPCYDVGYSNCGTVVAIGKNIPKEYLGKRMMTINNHQKYTIVKNTPDRAYHDMVFVPEGVEPEDAVFATLAVVANGSIRCSQIRPGEACVVYGAGIVGQMVARLAKLAGSTTVIVADVSDLRLCMVPKDPCFVTVNSQTTYVPQFVKETFAKDSGVPYVFETTGVGALAQEQLLCLCKRGKLIITSSPKTSSTIDLNYVNSLGLSIIGAHNSAVHPVVETPFNRWTRRRDTDFLLEAMAKKMFSAKDLNTHRYHYKDALAAYEMLINDRTQAMSVVLDWRD